MKTGGGGLLIFLEHLRCQSLSRPLSQYVNLLLPSNAPECLNTYSSSHPSANQQSMPTSAVLVDPLTFQSVSAALLPIHPHTTARTCAECLTSNHPSIHQNTRASRQIKTNRQVCMRCELQLCEHLFCLIFYIMFVKTNIHF